MHFNWETWEIRLRWVSGREIGRISQNARLALFRCLAANSPSSRMCGHDAPLRLRLGLALPSSHGFHAITFTCRSLSHDTAPYRASQDSFP